MIVFEIGFDVGQPDAGITNSRTRIDEVAPPSSGHADRHQHRRVGLITYGPGPYTQCNSKSIQAGRQDARVITRAVTPGDCARRAPRGCRAGREGLNYRSKLADRGERRTRGQRGSRATGKGASSLRRSLPFTSSPSAMKPSIEGRRRVMDYASPRIAGSMSETTRGDLVRDGEDADCPISENRPRHITR